MSIRFVPLPAHVAAAYRNGGNDANGQPPERHVATSDGLPCRRCLGLITEGEPYLILSHRPFPAPQPYAETGPIFLHAGACEPQAAGSALPVFLDSPRYMIRGYDRHDRIVYGSGAIVATGEIPREAARLLAEPGIAYVHVRSASNNCYHCRIERA